MNVLKTWITIRKIQTALHKYTHQKPESEVMFMQSGSRNVSCDLCPARTAHIFNSDDQIHASWPSSSICVLNKWSCHMTMIKYHKAVFSSRTRIETLSNMNSTNPWTVSLSDSLFLIKFYSKAHLGLSDVLLRKHLLYPHTYRPDFFTGSFILNSYCRLFIIYAWSLQPTFSPSDFWWGHFLKVLLN